MLDNSSSLQNDKNLYIETCRFVAAIVIMLHHTESLGGYRIASGGWIFVEFFFMLSGYFMTKHFESLEMNPECIEKTAFSYTVLKLLRILPYAIVGICIDAIAQVGIGVISIKDVGALIGELPIHFLLLKGFDFVKFKLDEPLWFLTGILVTMPVIICIMIRIKSFYKYVASWLFPLLIYSAMYMVNGGIQYWGIYWPLNSMLRAIAGMMIGSVVYHISHHISKRRLKIEIRRLLSILELLLFASLLGLALTTDCMDFTIQSILYSAAIICISFSGQDCIYIPAWGKKIGGLSVPLYCLHRPAFDLVHWLFGSIAFEVRLWLGIGITFLISGIMFHVVTNIKKSVYSVTRLG